MHREKETKMNAITTDEVKAMIHNIDVRLDQKSHYDTTHTPKGIIYHVGDRKYVTLDDFAQAFDDYEWDHTDADYACHMYILCKNNPERIDFYVQAYNIGGIRVLEEIYNAIDETGTASVVYYTYNH